MLFLDLPMVKNVFHSNRKFTCDKIISVSINKSVLKTLNKNLFII
jgi:hypothetical protein